MALFTRNIGFLTNISQIRTLTLTRVCLAEPPRKKRRMDPALLKLRVERKIRKTEREINRIEREPRHPIPLLEFELNGSEIRDLQQKPGHPPLENPLIIKGAQKLWCMYRAKQNKLEQKSLKQVMQAQERALERLKIIDKALYDRTVMVDDDLLPYASNFVKKETGPNENYKPPDGHIKDITKDWVM